MATATLQPTIDEVRIRVNDATVQRSSRRLLLLMVTAAWLIRMVVVLVIFRDLPDPARHYESFGNEVGWIARSIALNQGFSSPFYPVSGATALLPPLYPFLLSILFRIFGIYSVGAALTILTLNSILSSLTCIPIYLAARLSLNSRVALFAGWGWVIYPFAIYFSAGRVWEFSLTSLLITTCFYLSLRLHLRGPLGWLGFGALYGVAGLSNPAVFSLFPVLLVLPLYRLWSLRREAGFSPLAALFNRNLLRNGVLAAFSLLAVLTPWTIRNYRTLHVLCPVRDGFWYEFWSANNGDGSNPNLAWTHPASSPFEMDLYRAQGEIPYIAQKHDLARQFVATHKGFFVGLTARRILCYWTGFWSLDPAYEESEPFQLPNVFFCTSLTLLMLLGAYQWGRRDCANALPYLLAIAIFPVPYYLSHPLMDYRQPIEPEIVILVVVGLSALKSRIATRIAAAKATRTA